MNFTSIIYKIRNDRSFFEFTSYEDLKVLAEQNAGMKCNMDWENVFQVIKMIARTERSSYAVERTIDSELDLGEKTISVNEIFNAFLEDHFNLFKDIIKSHQFITNVIKHYIKELLEDDKRILEAETNYIFEIVE